MKNNIQWLLAALASIILASCTAPRVCGECDGERLCGDTRAQAEKACPGRFVPDNTPDGGDVDQGDGPVSGDGSPDEGNGDDGSVDVHPGDAGPADARTDAADSDLPTDSTPDAQPDMGDASPCMPVPGILEECNGLDDNCNGETDEDAIGGGQPCEVEETQGVCAQGTRICTEGAFACQSSVGPSGEVCDGLDNDCDGSTDEDEDGTPLSETCYDGQDGTQGIGTCLAGTKTCEEGRMSACAGQVLPVDETCDTLDNDCDGNIDNVAGAGSRCEAGQGICLTVGIFQCNAGELVCDAEPSEGTEEICDQLDNDCDGAIDEEFIGQLGLPCTSGLGICAREGVGICDAGGGTTCSVGPGEPSPEICDGVDNNCNGETDENNPGGGGACDTGLLGVCASGITACVEGALVCNGEKNPGEDDEVCIDGRDNNCNGEVDEDCRCTPRMGYPCYNGPAGTAGRGLCQTGTQMCDGQGQNLSECVGEVTPAQEICDGEDNDCDGNIDEVLGAGEACTLGQGICLDNGVWVCGEGMLVCDASPSAPQVETCNGLDDDCNGSVDNVAGVGEICNAGVGACARPGVRVCSLQGPVCNAVPGNPAPNEMCDGVDNNCNGSVDEGCPGAPPRQILIDYPGEEQFLIDEREVTLGHFRYCDLDMSCQAGADQLPIVEITVAEARRHCEMRGGRLPTRGEWELAAYGLSRLYPWGDRPDPTCQRVVMNDPAAGGSGCGANALAPVCSKQLGNSPEGVCDLFGNAFEWIEECSDFTDDCLVMGGSFANVAVDLPNGENRVGVNDTSRFVGFRCAYNVQ